MLRREFGRSSEFVEWAREFERDEFVTFLAQLRDQDVHVSPFRPGYVVEATPRCANWYWTFDRHPEMPEDADPDEWADDWEWDHGEPAPSREVVHVCGEMVAALESWVAKARVQFPGPSARVANR